MKYQGASTESKQESIEDTLHSETEVTEEETDENSLLGWEIRGDHFWCPLIFPMKLNLFWGALLSREFEGMWPKTSK